MSTMADVIRVPREHLRTSLAALRGSSSATPGAAALAELPLRVVALEDGSFEIVDGFKRYRRWVAEGMTSVPVVIEPAASAIERKLLVLRSNAPPRTLGPMDEARVIDALLREDGLTPTAVARLLGRRVSWVARRLALLTRLAPALQARVEQGTLRLSLACALSAQGAAEQVELLRAIDHHGLTDREGTALLALWRASTPAERAGVLRDPWPALRPAAPTESLSPRAADLEARLQRIREALHDLASFQLPEHGLDPAARRRLEAQHRSLIADLHNLARTHSVPGSIPTEVPHVEESLSTAGNGSSLPATATHSTALAPPAPPPTDRSDGSRAAASPAALHQRLRHPLDRREARP